MRGDKIKAKVIIGKEAAVTHISQDREMFGHLCGLENSHVLTVFRHDHEVVNLCLDLAQSQCGLL